VAFVRITIGLEKHVTQGLSALKVCLDEIRWTPQQAGQAANHGSEDGEREFE
jgi:histidinol-phosphate aminotransferase